MPPYSVPIVMLNPPKKMAKLPAGLLAIALPLI
jgi:hypothetical protein